MSIPVSLPTTTGVRLRQLHDVALASPPATTALPLVYAPSEGRWKAQQIGSDGIADGAITFPKLAADVGTGFDGRWVNVTGDTMTGPLVINSSGAIALTLRNAAATDNVQLRFRGNQTAVDQWAIGNEVSTNAVGRNFDIYDVVAGSNRLRINSSGKVALTPASGSGSSGITLTEPGANDASIALVSSTAPRTWLMLVEGTRGAANVGPAGSFSLFDGSVGTSRLTIDTAGKTTLKGQVVVESATVSPLVVSNPTNATGSNASVNFATGSGYSTKLGALQDQFWFAFMDGGNVVQWGDDGTNLRLLTRSISLDATRNIVFYNEAKDDKIQLYSGYTLGIRGGTLGYFVNTGAIHNFFVNNASILQVTGSAILAQTSFQQSGGYAYLGSYNTGAGIYPRAGVDLAVGWNFTSGYREMALWNTDTAAAISFTFRQLQGSGQKLLTQIDANGRHTINGKLDVTSDFVSEPMFRVMNSGSTHLFGIWWNGAIILNSANVNGTTNTGFGAAPAAGHRHIQVMDQSYNTIGYIPIYS